MPAETRYKKLPGGGSMLFQYVRLYLGPDHLLQVMSTGFTESYKRFFLADIQAFTLRQTVAGKVWNGVWIGLAVLFASLSLAAGDDAFVPLASIAIFWLVLLAINMILGPSCACYVKTAVQTQKLPTLKRVRRARKVIERLRPLIADAQGSMTDEDLNRLLDPAAQLPTAGGTEPPIVTS